MTKISCFILMTVLAVSLLWMVGPVRSSEPQCSLNLEVRQRNGEVSMLLLKLRLLPGDEFSVLYRHSVEQTWVEEIFGWSSDGLLLKSVRFASLGAGLPFSDEGGSLTVDDAEFVIEHLDILVTSFSFMPIPENEYTIRWGTVELELASLPSGASVWIGPSEKP